MSFNSLPIMGTFFCPFSGFFWFAFGKLLLLHINLSLELRLTAVNLCVCGGGLLHTSKDTEINFELKSCSYLESGSSVTAGSAGSNVLLTE